MNPWQSGGGLAVAFAVTLAAMAVSLRWRRADAARWWSAPAIALPLTAAGLAAATVR